MPIWHTRLLAIVALWQVLGVYKSWLDVPFWDSQAEWVRARAEDQTLSDEEEEDVLPDLDSDDDDADHPNPRQDRRDVGDAAAARAAADAVDGAKAQASDDKGTTTDNAKETIKELRAKSKNTVFVCGFIISKDNCKIEVPINSEMCRPVWTAHSIHASECRDAEHVLDYYQRSALGIDCMRTPEDTAKVLMNVQTLYRIGFTTECGSLPKKLKITDDFVQVDIVTTPNAIHRTHNDPEITLQTHDSIILDQLQAESHRAAAGTSLREAVQSGNAGFRPSSSGAGLKLGGKVMGQLSLVTANTYKPPHTILYHDPMQCRIRGFYGPKRVGKSCNLADGQDVAIRFVLVQMWQLHTRAHQGEQCPWSFQCLRFSD